MQRWALHFSRYIIVLRSRSVKTTDRFLDHAYVLAYSLVLLHSDAFNQANKVKMQKADYVRNTKLPGVFPEVLEVSFKRTTPDLATQSTPRSISTTTSLRNRLGEPTPIRTTSSSTMSEMRWTSVSEHQYRLL